MPNKPRFYRDPANNAVKCITCEGYPDFDGVEYTCPHPECNVEECDCTHTFIRHEGDTGGHCMDCGCLEFEDAVRSN